MSSEKPPINSEKPAMSSEKLQKALAASGLGSRREMERWIQAGRIIVNGSKATLGDRVEAEDKISVDGRPLKRLAPKEKRSRVLIYNKPEGQITSKNDPEGRATVFDSLPNIPGERWVSVGRLDYNTSGLLIFTNDGELANALMHPSTSVEREYLCRIMGEVNNEMLQNLVDGVQLEDGVAKFDRIDIAGGKGINRWFQVTLKEGKNREVRRLWESQGMMVSRLKRVRYASVVIPPILSEGKWMELDQKGITELYKQVDMRRKRERRLTPAELTQQQRQIDRLKKRGTSGRNKSK
jgi:23S rRNA pseudouridine2605 synthase